MHSITVYHRWNEFLTYYILYGWYACVCRYMHAFGFIHSELRSSCHMNRMPFYFKKYIYIITTNSPLPMDHTLSTCADRNHIDHPTMGGLGATYTVVSVLNISLRIHVFMHSCLTQTHKSACHAHTHASMHAHTHIDKYSHSI